MIGSGVLTVAHLTVHEARRRRVLLAAVVLGSIFLTVFGFGFYFVDQELRDEVARGKTLIVESNQVRNFLIIAGMYAANFLVVVTSVLMPIDTLSGEIGSGAIQTLATKPVGRWQILFGKWLGYWSMLFCYVLLIPGGVLAVARVISGFSPSGIGVGLPLIFLEGTLLMSVTILGGTRLSTLANGMLGFGLYGVGFVGWWMEFAGTILDNETTRSIGIAASLIVPSESLWGLAAYHMQTPLMRQLQLTPFSPPSVPSNLMVVWAIGYVVVTLAAATWSFRRRNL